MNFGVFIAGHWTDHSISPVDFYDQIIEQAVLADRLGYSTVWLPEHYLIDYIAIPDPLQLAAIILERTKNIRIGVAVFIAPNHHPLQLASKIAQMDVLSRGRFQATIGRGSSGYELRQFQLSRTQDESLAHFREYIEILGKAWCERASFAYAGSHFKFSNARLIPPPYSIQPPFWLAAQTEGSARGNVKNCVEVGNPVRLIHSPFREPFGFVEKVYASFLIALGEHGVARRDALFAVNRTAYVAEDEAQVREILPTMRNLHRGLVSMLGDTEAVIDGYVQFNPAANELTDEQMLENTLIGTSDQVRAKAQKYAALGVDHLSCYMSMGQPQAKVIRSMELFSRDVIVPLSRAGSST